MKKILALSLGLAMGLASGAALAKDKLTLQLKWVTQAQFAGYYVAKEKGSSNGCRRRSPLGSAVFLWSTSPSRSNDRA